MRTVNNPEGTAKYAGLPNIEYKLRLARRYAADAAREVRWLEELLAERRRQIEAGEWPPPPPEQPAVHPMWAKHDRKEAAGG